MTGNQRLVLALLQRGAPIVHSRAWLAAHMREHGARVKPDGAGRAADALVDLGYAARAEHHLGGHGYRLTDAGRAYRLRARV
jgi:hypothetical protein